MASRPLPGGQYFARLTQRLLAALSAPTAEGTLYDVDFRLRPSGKSGPIATHVDAFAAYQAKEAWTWEHMALTRARPIAGDAELMTRADKEIAAVLRRRRDRKKVVADVLEMRAMIEAEKGGEGPWDLKQAPGGLVDIEFIAQYVELIHGAAHPELLSTETDAVLVEAAKAGLLPAAEVELLRAALRALSGAHADPAALRRRRLQAGGGAARPSRSAGASRRHARFRHPRSPPPRHASATCAPHSSG